MQNIITSRLFSMSSLAARRSTLPLSTLSFKNFFHTSILLASNTESTTGSQYAVKVDPDFDNPKWVERHRFMFDLLDKNGDGAITLDEIVDKANDDICAKLNASPEQTQRHLEAVEAFFKKMGMDYGKEVEFPEFVEGWKELAEYDLDLWAQDKRTLIRDWGDAVFDIFDADGSGLISLDEWKAYGRISGICPSDADAEKTFAMCDLDDSGQLDVDEMTRQHLGFWYTLDPNADGLYGDFIP